MKHWNELENQLRSWTPRAPSPKLEARLFGAAEAAEARAGHPAGRAAWHWLAPAMAMFMLCLFVAGRSPGGLGAGQDMLAQFAMTEPERATHYANNSVQRTSFDWTNGGPSLTTPLPVSRTNSLFQ